MSLPHVRTVRVLVVDDSPIVREILTSILDRQEEFEVVGFAESGSEAARKAAALKPDVISMDLLMPETDGFEGIARIMAETPTPILVLTSERGEVAAFRALSLGALDLLEKPPADMDLASYGLQLRRRLRLLASVPVIRHMRGLKQPRPAPVATRRVELVAIAASLGGPRALTALFKSLPPDFGVPIAVVQHMAEGFTEGLTRWIRQETGRDVREAQEGEPLEPGMIRFAPAGKHLLLERGRARLEDGPPIHGFRPSATPLFRSAAKSYGPRACGVMLTGMGDDGADGLLELRQAGGTTIAQDEASCVVFGMPRAAIQVGAVETVLPLDRIGAALAEVVK